MCVCEKLENNPRKIVTWKVLSDDYDGSHVVMAVGGLGHRDIRSLGHKTST